MEEQEIIEQDNAIQEEQQLQHLINLHIQLDKQIKILEDEKELLRQRIKNIMEQNQKDAYVDNEGNKVLISKYDMKTFDKSKAQLLMEPQQYESCFKTKAVVNMKVLSKESADKMSAFLKNKSD